MRSVARWASGIVLLWGTFAMLWMPWADYQKSYRSVALQLRSKIPVGAGCMAQRSLGVSQAAALDYHAGIRARALRHRSSPNACPLMLVQGSPQHEFDGPGAGWAKLADVGRPGDRSERYRLYRLPTMNTTPSRRMPVLGQARAPRGELARRAPARSVRQRRARAAAQFAAEAPGVRYDYSRQRLGAMTLRLLAHLAAERGFSEWREALFAGKAINTTENRAAWHTALRAGDSAPRKSRTRSARCSSWSNVFRNEKPSSRIVNLGTGGSDLGPRLVADALAATARSTCASPPTSIRATCERALEGAEPDEHAVHRGVRRPSPRRRRWRTPSARARRGAARHFIADHLEHAEAQGVRRDRGPADVGLGRRALLGVVGGGLCRRLRDWVSTRFAEFLQGGRDDGRALRATSRSRRTCRR